MTQVVRAVRHVHRATAACLLLAILLSAIAAHASSAEDGSGMLTGTRTVDQIRRHLSPAFLWHPFPRAGERDRWISLPAEVRRAYVRQAEQLLHGDWAPLKATDFLGYVRTGNRSEYQDLSFGRRHRLAALVIAECVEGKGRFRDEIVNGLWSICEESYWGVPAHVGMQRKGRGLPDVTEPTVDLFAAETGSLLAWTYYLLKDSLNLVSPLVSERIKYEVDRRINTVNLERDDFWWMGRGRSVNNWTPWICSNWLTTVLILEEDTVRRARAVHKILGCLDRFLDVYADDGGCDEGPVYWGRAGGSLFDCLELLHSATAGFIDGFGRPRVKEIGRYITRVHIAGSRFVNFADAAASHRPDAATIFRYGKAIGDTSMMEFGASVAQEQRLGEVTLPGQFGVLGRVVPALFALENLLKTRPAEPSIRDSWFPGIQVMTARSVAGSAKGLFLAAQGGHNAESHNHNDVGNFIVYLDGEPVLIDVGVETYTSKTFSQDRYSLWTMQSQFHNVPTINGVQQKAGREFAAKDVRYGVTDGSASLSMDIAGAYPPEAGVVSWKRTLSLERGREVVVRDAYRLGSAPQGISLTLMTCREPVMEAHGTVVLGRSPEIGPDNPAEIIYDPALFSARAERIELHDPQLHSSWGKNVWRIVLTMEETILENEFAVRVRARQAR